MNQQQLDQFSAAIEDHHAHELCENVRRANVDCILHWNQLRSDYDNIGKYTPAIGEAGRLYIHSLGDDVFTAFNFQDLWNAMFAAAKSGQN